MITKLVESNHYHIWTDALHTRQLARQTSNKWDRGTYVRCTLLTSWVCLEIACQDALDDESISHSFRRNLDAAISIKSLQPLDWGKGVWQKVTHIQELRKNVAHRFASETELFPDLEIADRAIKTVREAIIDIYQHSNKPNPEWVTDDFDEGWMTGVISMHGTGGPLSPYADNKEAIVVSYIYKGHEYIQSYLSPDADIDQPIENFFRPIGKPITAVHLSRDGEVLVEFVFDKEKIRGA
jgi:hypothetical protein